jgi:N6-adenosine-specific RNA methylase IME4/ParB-like chromosome segregation protein Spo0J
MATLGGNPLPDLSEHDREALKKSLAEIGQQYPIIKSAGPMMKGKIVDGFHREAILKELGIKPKYVLEKFTTMAAFRLRQIDLNVARRQLTIPQRAALAMAREPWERELAAQRMRAGGKGAASSGQGSAASGRASVLAASAVGLKKSTYEHAKFVLEKAPAEIKRRFERGEITADRAYREAKRATGSDARTVLARRVIQRMGELPGGKYSALVIAPPWRSQPMKFEKGRLISTELATLDINAIAARDAIVALWTTNLWLPEAYTVLDAWGARAFAVVTWVLDDAVATETLRDRTKHAILATFGKPPAATRKSNVIMGGTGLRLTGEIFEIIESLAPGSSRLAMFCETGRAGWKVWSPEVE